MHHGRSRTGFVTDSGWHKEETGRYDGSYRPVSLGYAAKVQLYRRLVIMGADCVRDVNRQPGADVQGATWIVSPELTAVGRQGSPAQS
ncbi:hypothetical protein PA598K_03220 [Paenibacillus sp. 598K]|nr:hypothetical protein PA598K_03220 [Paenibacillus sp. 598K]